MKAISIKLEVPEWVDEEKFAARLKRIAEKMGYPEKLSAEEVREKEKEKFMEMWIARFLR